jgi:hypothetical protein
MILLKLFGQIYLAFCESDYEVHGTEVMKAPVNEQENYRESDFIEQVTRRLSNFKGKQEGCNINKYYVCLKLTINLSFDACRSS